MGAHLSRRQDPSEGGLHDAIFSMGRVATDSGVGTLPGPGTNVDRGYGPGHARVQDVPATRTANWKLHIGDVRRQSGYGNDVWRLAREMAAAAR